MSFTTRLDVERFRTAIARRMGLEFEDGKHAFLESVLSRALERRQQRAETYLGTLEREASREEIGCLAPELTVGETYFFRNIEQFRALAEVALPERLRAQAASKSLRLLSAGCASGDEAFSLAIQLRDSLPDPSWQVSIRAVDVNPKIVERARRGRFTNWSLREAPAELRDRWFRLQGNELILDERVQSAVRFEQRNLIEDDPELWQSGTYDVVFCRNVIMYFTLEQQRAVIRRIARSLAKDGFLFLGHAETLSGLSNDFHLRHTHATFYYQLKAAGDSRELVATQRSFAPAASATALSELVETKDTWVDAIRSASERVAALTDGAAARSPGARAPSAAWDLGLVFELLRNERFGEALELLRKLPPESERDPDVLLLRAVLLAHGGRLAEAEQVCRHLLSTNELSAGAHYVLALCREGSRDLKAAVDHDQVAVYLDPAFAMPRLHLGLLARKSGDHDRGRRDLGQALVLLEREDASRLLLFGGGFRREALIALCRAELVACGGAP